MMSFAVATIARDVGMKPDGSFSGTGDYLFLKCFYGQEHSLEYGEFFLILNPTLGCGEITMKDPGYAESLVKAFQKTMKGE